MGAHSRRRAQGSRRKEALSRKAQRKLIATSIIGGTLSVVGVEQVFASPEALAVQQVGEPCAVTDAGCHATKQQGLDVEGKDPKFTFTQAEHRKIVELQQMLERMPVPEGFVRAFRVEVEGYKKPGGERSNQHVTYVPGQGVRLETDKEVFLNFGDTYRAASYLFMRINDREYPDVVLRQFVIPKAQYDSIREHAVDENQRRVYPGAPIRVDKNSPDQYGLPPKVAADLNTAITESGNRQFMEVKPAKLASSAGDRSTFDYPVSRLFDNAGNQVSELPPQQSQSRLQSRSQSGMQDAETQKAGTEERYTFTPRQKQRTPETRTQETQTEQQASSQQQPLHQEPAGQQVQQPLHQEPAGQQVQSSLHQEPAGQRHDVATQTDGPKSVGTQTECAGGGRSLPLAGCLPGVPSEATDGPSPRRVDTCSCRYAASAMLRDAS